ncbi:hypothetical protein ACN27F_04150 [Solwaraspora sp. WMMB335]|uniref:hypothetical protein n=1 Tax=Solwaraspora sp. WMMB335 TaxID=3404118 RepID=UPI003B944EA3
MTVRDVMYGGMYLAACRFANVDRFVEFVAARIDLDTVVTAEAAAAMLRALADDLAPQGQGPVRDEASALHILVAEDLRTIAATPLPDAESSVRERIDAAAGSIKTRLTQVGLDLGESDLHIVDEFPAPFNQFGWAAFAPDREDEERYDIRPGVYFRRDALRPIYSEALFAHELIHTVPGRVDPEVYAMGLEEGIAEVLGTCFAATAAVPLAALRNVLVYGRHGVERPKLWSLYRDHTRQANLLYREFGIEGLVELAHRGRASIHAAEIAVFSGTFGQLDLPRGSWNDDTTALLDAFCAGYLPSHVFTPLEVVLLDEVDEGRSLVEVCRQADVPAEVGVPVLKRLGSESALFARDGEQVGYSNVRHYLAMSEAANQPVIRYLPPSGSTSRR